MKITFIGGGNMVAALIGGMKKQGFSATTMRVVEPQAAARARLTDAFGVHCVPTVDAITLDCEVLVLAVKPQHMHAAVAPLAGQLRSQLVVSVAAGLRLPDLARWLGSDGDFSDMKMGHGQYEQYGKATSTKHENWGGPLYRCLVRAMPNTPVMIGAGITALCADAAVPLEERAKAEKILAAVGRVLWIEDEAQMDAVTAVSGSGPAYVFYFIEALEAAARDLGLAADAARRLSLDTFLGATRLAESSAEPVSLLRERVTSKGGTTEAALNLFATENIAAAIRCGVQAAATRSRELGDQLGKD
jgi:pyrroline-5-carboxylate reductase